MHMPDGFLSGEAAALRRGRRRRPGSRSACAAPAPSSASATCPSPAWPRAFFLVGDAPMFPVAVGTQGHLLGGTLAVALLGPWLGAITIAVVCAVQALAPRRRRRSRRSG